MSIVPSVSGYNIPKDEILRDEILKDKILRDIIHVEILPYNLGKTSMQEL